MSVDYQDAGTCPHNAIYQEVDDLMHASPLFTREVRFIDQGEGVWGMFRIVDPYTNEIPSTRGHRLVGTFEQGDLREELCSLVSQRYKPRSIRIVERKNTFHPKLWDVYSLDHWDAPEHAQHELMPLPSIPAEDMPVYEQGKAYADKDDRVPSHILAKQPAPWRRGYLERISEIEYLIDTAAQARSFDPMRNNA